MNQIIESPEQSTTEHTNEISKANTGETAGNLSPNSYVITENDITVDTADTVESTTIAPGPLPGTTSNTTFDADDIVLGSDVSSTTIPYTTVSANTTSYPSTTYLPSTTQSIHDPMYQTTETTTGPSIPYPSTTQDQSDADDLDLDTGIVINAVSAVCSTAYSYVPSLDTIKSYSYVPVSSAVYGAYSYLIGSCLGPFANTDTSLGHDDAPTTTIPPTQLSSTTIQYGSRCTSVPCVRYISSPPCALCTPTTISYPQTTCTNCSACPSYRCYGYGTTIPPTTGTSTTSDPSVGTIVPSTVGMTNETTSITSTEGESTVSHPDQTTDVPTTSQGTVQADSVTASITQSL